MCMPVSPEIIEGAKRPAHNCVYNCVLSHQQLITSFMCHKDAEPTSVLAMEQVVHMVM